MNLLDKERSVDILIEKNLNQYFYKALSEINSEIISPVSDEFLVYSCDVLERYALASRLDLSRPLGLQLLELEQYEGYLKNRKIQEIGDKALLISSYFSRSISKKIIDKSYYKKIGQSAYQKLNDHLPEYYDISMFFNKLSNNFEILMALFLRLSLELNSKNEDEYQLKVLEIESELSYIERLVLKIDRKISAAS